METQDKRPAPPYLSFTTLNNFIDGLGVNMPTRIDKSLMKSMSGASQAALVSALDYLKLRDGDKPSESLIRLAAASGSDRAPLWKALLEERYPFLFSERGFDLRRATQGELDERFREEGASGETIRKCVAFFTAAAQAAGIEVSPYFRSIKSRAPRSRGAVTPRLSRKARRNAIKEEPEERTQPPPAPLNTRLHPAVQAWIDEMPDRDEDWDEADFAEWLLLLEASIRRAYKLPQKEQAKGSS